MLCGRGSVGALPRRDRGDSQVRCLAWVWWRSSSLTMNCGCLAWGYGTDGSTDYFWYRTVGATLGEPGLFRLLRALAVWQVRSSFMVHPLPQRFRQQTLEFLCALGVLRKTCVRQGRMTTQIVAYSRILRCFRFFVDFLEPSMTHSCELSRAGGAGVAASLLPGDSASGLPISS